MFELLLVTTLMFVPALLWVILAMILAYAKGDVNPARHDSHCQEGIAAVAR